MTKGKEMETDMFEENEKALKKVSEFLNVSKDLLKQQDSNLIMKMIEAAAADKMIDVHHFGMEMKDRF
jgi:hypothetical protein